LFKNKVPYFLVIGVTVTSSCPRVDRGHD
jgi:hypothetical protein